jgi:hypothetical protein
MLVPEIVVPRSAGDYAFDVSKIQVEGCSQYDKINNDIGQRINPDFEAGLKWTPVQKKRIFAITTIVLSTLGIGLTITTGAVASGTITFVAIALVFAAGMSIWYLRTLEQDLDSPRNRKIVMNEIAQWPHHVVIQKTLSCYSVDEIVGYALLDKITGTNQNSAPRNQFYAKFVPLGLMFNRITELHFSNLHQIEKQFKEAIGGVKRWRDDLERIMDPLNIFARIADLIAFIQRAPKTSTMTMQEVEQKYHDAIAPAVRWKELEVSKADAARKEAITKLNLAKSYSAAIECLTKEMESNKQNK